MLVAVGVTVGVGTGVSVGVLVFVTVFVGVRVGVVVLVTLSVVAVKVGTNVLNHVTVSYLISCTFSEFINCAHVNNKATPVSNITLTATYLFIEISPYLFVIVHTRY